MTLSLLEFVMKTLSFEWMAVVEGVSAPRHSGKRVYPRTTLTRGVSCTTVMLKGLKAD